ncbi:hypothetical protein [Deinococcus sp.]|uniref:hypothetical protein n=1 Tax=Deinococcus sp. TaxID=47478 RepID=UPI003C7D50DF
MSVPLPVTNRDVRAHLDYLELPLDVHYSCVSYERSHLTFAERSLLDDGDLLPAWGTWWLTLAAELAYGPLGPALLVKPERDRLGRSRLRQAPLRVSDMIEELASSGFSSTGTFSMIWGVVSAPSPSALLRCAGAVFPVADNAAAALFVDSASRDRLRPWLLS